MNESSLDKLIRKRQQLDNKIRDKQARLRQAERKRDTRRKIIVGAIAMEHADQGKDQEFAATLFRLLDRYVIKPGDRALLNLPPLSQDNEDSLSQEFPDTAKGK